MSKQDMIEIEGTVVEALPNAQFQVTPDELHPYSAGRQSDGRNVAI